MMIATILFIASAVGIALLFALKYAEVRTGRTLARGVRTRADQRALALKQYLSEATVIAAHLPPVLARVCLVLVRETALSLAAFARFLERQAHRIADMVSYKRGFERKAPRSEFLSQINGKRDGSLDTPDQDRQNGTLPR